MTKSIHSLHPHAGRLAASAALASMLAACGGHAVVLPPPAPPPAPEVSPELLEAAQTQRAHDLWDQGTALGRRGQWAQAEQAYRQAVALRPDSVTYRMALTTALLQEGRDSDAADALLAAIRLEEAAPTPNHGLIAVDYERLIQILERVNRLDEARTARERQRFHRMMRDAQPTG
jgi:tetratricopeptide (TPR) repeat protein